MLYERMPNYQPLRCCEHLSASRRCDCSESWRPRYVRHNPHGDVTVDDRARVGIAFYTRKDSYNYTLMLGKLYAEHPV